MKIRSVDIKNFEIPKYRRPSTPGHLLRELFLKDPTFGFTQGQVADRLGISRQNFNAILNGKRAITPVMAMRLERVIGVDAQTWLNLQLEVDLYDALYGPEAKQIAKLKPLRPRKRLKRSRAA
jgi:antitoxin HigA-1